MSTVSGVLLAAAVVDASGLAKTVARSKHGLWTLVPPAGSQFFETTVDALAWAVGGPGPARHFARTGRDLAGANLLCEVWTLAIDADGQPLPAGGGALQATRLHQFLQPLSERLVFSPPSSPTRAVIQGFDDPRSGPFSFACSSSQYLLSLPFINPGYSVLGWDTAYSPPGGTPAGQADIRTCAFNIGGPGPNLPTSGPVPARFQPLQWVPVTIPGRPEIKYEIRLPASFSWPASFPADFPGTFQPGTQIPIPNEWTSVATSGTGVTDGGGTISGAPEQDVAHTNWGLRYDELTDETVWLLLRLIHLRWGYFLSIPTTFTVKLYGGGTRVQAGILETASTYDVPVAGLRVRRNGIATYDDLPSGIVSLAASEGAFPSTGQTFGLSSPGPTATMPGLGAIVGGPGLIQYPLARAGGDFAALYQDPVTPTRVTLLNRSGVVGVLPIPVPAGGPVALNLVEITERGGRLYLMQLV